MTKRIITVVAGMAGVGGLLAGASALGTTSSSQAILNTADYNKCVYTGQAGAVTKTLRAKANNSAGVHTVCGVFYVTGV